MSKCRKAIFLLLILVSVVGAAYIVYNSENTYSAASYSLSISGTSLNAGDTKTLTIKTSADTSSADGTVVSNDPTCVEIVQVKSGTGGKTTGYFAAFDSSGDGITSAGTITIKGLRAGCSTTLTMKNVSIGDVNLHEVKGLTFTSGTIKVNEVTTVVTTQPVTQAPVTTTQAQTTTKATPQKTGSNNNLLSSLKIIGYDLDKNFNSNVTSYAINVQAAVKSLTIDAKAQDKNAKVSVTGNDELKSGTNTINIIVTAEDGSKKTYKVKVIKEIDPNEEPDIKGVEVTTEPIKEEKEEDLNNTYLKELLVSNGSLDKAFDKKEHVYYYDKNANITIDKAIPEIETNEVTIYKIDKGYVIMVENDLGDRGFYLLIEKNSFMTILLLIIIGVLLLIIVGLVIYIIKKTSKE